MEKGDILVALVMALALLIIFISFMAEVEIPEHSHIYQGMLNTTQLYELSNSTYLKVYFSRSCPACKKQIPVLIELADEGVFIQLIDVYEFTDSAVADNISVTPTMFVISPRNMTRIEGFVSREDLDKRLEE